MPSKDNYYPDLVLVPAAVYSATFVTKVFKFTPKVAAFFLSVTASTGTVETLDVIIEEWDAASNTFRTINTFTQATGVTTERRLENEDGLTPFGALIRATLTFGGTDPVFTFSLTASGKL